MSLLCIRSRRLNGRGQSCYVSETAVELGLALNQRLREQTKPAKLTNETKLGCYAEGDPSHGDTQQLLAANSKNRTEYA